MLVRLHIHFIILNVLLQPALWISVTVLLSLLIEVVRVEVGFYLMPLHLLFHLALCWAYDRELFVLWFTSFSKWIVIMNMWYCLRLSKSKSSSSIWSLLLKRLHTFRSLFGLFCSEAKSDPNGLDVLLKVEWWCCSLFYI